MDSLPLEIKDQVFDLLSFSDIANYGFAFRHVFARIRPLYRLRLQNLVTEFKILSLGEQHGTPKYEIILKSECIRKEFYLVLLLCAGLDRITSNSSVRVWDEIIYDSLPIALFAAWHDARQHGYPAYSDLKCDNRCTDCRCGRCYAAIGLYLLGDMRAIRGNAGWPVIKRVAEATYLYIGVSSDPVLSTSCLNDFIRRHGTGQYVLIDDTRNITTMPFLTGVTVELYDNPVPHMSDDTDEYLHYLIAETL